jgi:phospholipase C
MYPLLCLCLLLAASFPCAHASLRGKIKHVLVLMLENRSFDHLLGFLKRLRPALDGCLPHLPHCANHADPAEEDSPVYAVQDDAVYQQTDPNHEVSGVRAQIYGAKDEETPNMGGFVASYAERMDGDGSSIMKCFSPENVPALTTLASEFALFDSYFSSVPGPTEPNRAFAISATSNGMSFNDVPVMIKGMPQKTIFRQVEEMGLDYNIYFAQAPAALMFKDLRHKDARHRYHFLDKLYEDLKSGDMPSYSWIEPAYFDTPLQPASDQHPNHDVSVGDQLIKNIYEAVRASPIWNETALIVTYDEHGGFFDHVPPLQEGVPSPDGLADENAIENGFNFTRQGVRVPFIVASPWIRKGLLVPNPSTGAQYEHSSIIATVVHKLLEPSAPFLRPSYLTARDAWAPTFEHIFDSPELRTDCPTQLPDVPNHRLLFPGSLPELTGDMLISEFQRNIILSLASAVGDFSVLQANLSSWTESVAGEWSINAMQKFMRSDK